MAARENILARIRARQGKPAVATEAELAVVKQQIAARTVSARPRMDWETLARFRERALGLSSTLDEVAAAADVPMAVARYLEALSLPRRAVIWQEFGQLDWRGAGIEIETRGARETDAVGVTGAFCAIAETGTLMTVTGPRMPATVSLLPETHVAVISASRIVRGMEEAWQLLRAELAELPRAVNFISGPSRTADIEQTVTLGAHGPYRVHIVLVG